CARGSTVVPDYW
nr:immunoglobulin heavy chain junction region [Homo sapiens]